MSVLRVSELSKSYVSYRSELFRVAAWFGMPADIASRTTVLDSISLTVGAGEALGIIGRNGAGKSTLLKIIAGTLSQSSGSFEIKGRTAAILELGMGFNQNLTGQENVFYAAGLAGFKPEEIRLKISQIAEFCELGEYFYQPIRTYSSGMQTRLAFAVATAWRPDMLIVDEALSVGDAYFQHKSFARIREFREQGTSLLMVSHDRNAIQEVCDRAILLEGGSIALEGRPEEVFDYYNALLAEGGASTVKVTKIEGRTALTTSGTGEARVQEIALCNKDGAEVHSVGVGEAVFLRIRAKIFSDIDRLVLGYGIKNRLGQIMYGTNTWHTKQTITNAKAGEEYLYKIAFPIKLGVGSYSVQTALCDSETHAQRNFEWRDQSLIFEVGNLEQVYFEGCCWNEPKITIEKLTS